MRNVCGVYRHELVQKINAFLSGRGLKRTVDVDYIRSQFDSLRQIVGTDFSRKDSLARKAREILIAVSVRGVEKNAIAVRTAGKRPHLETSRLQRSNLFLRCAAMKLHYIEMSLSHRRYDFAYSLRDKHADKLYPPWRGGQGGGDLGHRIDRDEART